MSTRQIPTEVESIDHLLQGGIERGALTLLYGEAGSGKTNLCLQLARNVVRQGQRVVFIDTEGVSLDRLKQMCDEKGDFDTVAKNILFFQPYSFEDQEKQIDEVIKVVESAKDIDLVIVDSATLFFRLKHSESDQGRSSLSYQIIRLLTLARRAQKAIVITSQVYFDIEGRRIRPLGGHSLFHNAKTILHLVKVDERRRRAVLMKHRAIHEGENADFELTGRGVE